MRHDKKRLSSPVAQRTGDFSNARTMSRMRLKLLAAMTITAGMLAAPPALAQVAPSSEEILLGDGGPRHVAIIRLLVNAGANVDLADRQRVTPLAHSERRGYAAIVLILESAGAED